MRERPWRGAGLPLLVMALALGVGAACSNSPASPEAQGQTLQPAKNGGFVFTLSSERETATDELATTDNRATHVRLVARCDYECHHRSGDWSPDGRSLVYVNECPDCANKLVIVAADGSGEKVIHEATFLSSPTWSPDGRQIAFVESHWPRSAPDWVSDIYVIERDGTGLRRVTRTPALSEDELDWSSGNMLVFRGSPEPFDYGNYELFTMKPNGQDLRQFTHNDVRDDQPDWSPDGKQLTFVRGHDKQAPPWKPQDPNGQIWTMDASGTNAERIASQGHSPVWAPDGTLIAFIRGASIHTVEPDGAHDVVIGSPIKEGSLSDLDWQPR